MTNPDGAPKAEAVTRFHSNSDRDNSPVAEHHTLGIGHNQASPGDHKHDGKTSKSILKGFNVGFPITAGAAYTQSQIQAIIDALRKLGAGS